MFSPRISRLEKLHYFLFVSSHILKVLFNRQSFASPYSPTPTYPFTNSPLFLPYPLLIMNHKDDIRDANRPQGYAHGWPAGSFYQSSSPRISHLTSYAMNQQHQMTHWVAEPIHLESDYSPSNVSHTSFPSHQNLPFSYSQGSSQGAQASPHYSPASTVGPYTPVPFSTPSASLAQFPRSYSSPRQPRMDIDESLPVDVRNAMQAAYASQEYAQGENVPADILLPTVQKVDKDLWRCRICNKDHKRRDHTLTHVRTAHLNNKGFRCQYEGCESAFGRKGDLERHENTTHQKNYDEACPYCQTQLHRKDNLSRHVKSCKAVGIAHHRRGASGDLGSSSLEASSSSYYPRSSTEIARPYRSTRQNPRGEHGATPYPTG